MAVALSVNLRPSLSMHSPVVARKLYRYSARTVFSVNFCPRLSMHSLVVARKPYRCFAQTLFSVHPAIFPDIGLTMIPEPYFLRAVVRAPVSQCIPVKSRSASP